MDSRVLIYLHHHGDFTSETFKGNANYVGGKVDIMENVDTNKLTMLTIQRGEDFLEEKNMAPMLPPDMPKKLRGRPKRLRRREEWEGSSQNRIQAKEDVQGLQKLTSGKKMYCRNCRLAGHKKPNCPLLKKTSEGAREGQAAEGEAQGAQGEEVPVEVPSEVQRQLATKLPIRRKARPGVVIKEPIAQGSQFSTTPPTSSKGKEKVCTKRQERPFWMQNKRKKCATQETTKSADIEKGAEMDKVAGNEDFVMEKIDHPDEKERERLEKFRANLIGIGLRKLFMPTPGFKNMDHQHNGTPAADTPPVQEDFDADEENESDEFTSP
ncbi:hypothetical protein DCAR_0830682 [Daucus carota subsp. sativus]|uniref:PB1-like domain-containing protein n=1 Tax=Daucus carota subsp. sativus TaxID=79200 RepID=A0AAF0XQ78_DAUCS|nr:hypothetical protein DCAR_0830682 [Daucus carota subsp. sativus]